MDGSERRQWTRYELTMTAQVRTGDFIESHDISDFSAGGASLQGQVPANDIQSIEVALDKFGAFPASVVRGWDDGFAVRFEHGDGGRNALQEDIDSFMRENDLMDG
ncbi:MAG: PilZ domain-containing protein [Rhodospirillales bacterium]|jgi:hypothetical protein|nr:PilZ domain-containing protein [Rhodospirillales bacterium]MBT4041050.1 PilZ domain-containing protein [Rhodospirillales bacterium]MBT4626407.1 PilZ domain-containing protein [Rhodospirillales bacterium]MBT5351195.1 PilZ domain-containing protein [Rhodospirillales bacterium]MBT5522109.1 PilZ domain-containing protein [Rhodospirillales bacterium]